MDKLSVKLVYVKNVAKEDFLLNFKKSQNVNIKKKIDRTFYTFYTLFTLILCKKFTNKICLES